MNVDLAEITAGSQGGFGANLSLTLTGSERSRDGCPVLTVRGLHKGRRVAFDVVLSSTWQRRKLADTNHMLYWGPVYLTKCGEESDRFLQALDEIYETRSGFSTMRNSVLYTAVSLSGHPLRFDRQTVKMKLFFETTAPEQYAEFYLNINPDNSSVEFHEKDDCYRQAVVLSLSGGKSGATGKRTLARSLARWLMRFRFGRKRTEKEDWM